jgi:DNA (cytosine-5)-methyltransferase 1
MSLHQSHYRVSPQIPMLLTSEEIDIDSFCGGGGASLGMEQSTGRAVHVAINHDPNAISMHTVNHPATKHYNESVWAVDPVEAAAGRPVGLMWLSPDCKHHSKAKGGKPVDKKIRGLAWIALKWGALAKPRVMLLENVEEFKDWGPLTRSGRPVKSRKGEEFRKWKRQLESIGYQVEYKTLNSCEYGAATARKRLFLVARRDGAPIHWPNKTHGPSGSKLKKFVPAASIIDWSIPTISIFGRKKPLAENTMNRIGKGVVKFAIESAKPFIMRIGQTGWGKDGYQYSLEKPLTTIVSKAEHCLVTPIIAPLSENSDEETDNTELCAAFISKYYAGNYTGAGISLRQPLHTITAVDHHALVTTHLVKLRGDNLGSSIYEPLHTISAQGTHHGEVRCLLLKYYGNETGGHDITMPIGTITATERFAIVMVKGSPYRIVDIGMRMLQPHELFLAQGFPKSYVFTHNAEGEKFTKREQVNKCGNSVVPLMAKLLTDVNYTPNKISLEAAA